MAATATHPAAPAGQTGSHARPTEAAGRWTPDGLFYKRVGGGLPCLVMHGGLGLDHTYLHPGLDPLGDSLDLVYYDHRGNGRSVRPPAETLTYEQFVDDADALRATLGFERTAVIGHSMGGFVALQYALRYPERVSHLILVDTAPTFDFWDEIEANIARKNPGEGALAAWNSPIVEDDDLRRFLQGAGPLYFLNYDPDVAARHFGRIEYCAAALRRSIELAATYDVTPRLGEIQVPALILVGRDDFICPVSRANILHAGIPRSELVVFEQSGHLPWIEEPEAFFGAVRGWLARTV